MFDFWLYLNILETYVPVLFQMQRLIKETQSTVK